MAFKSRHASAKTGAETPLISVVVPTRNNERTLAECLASVRAQNYAPVELVVVDNHSHDATARLAGETADQVIVAGPERSSQRNAGIEAAAGEWVLWLDSDMLLPDDALTRCVITADQTGAVAVALPERTIGAGFWTASRALERACYTDDPGLQNPRFVRRDYLLSIGGFDGSMAGPEDTDLRLRMVADGVACAVADVLVNHDEGHLRLAEVVRKRVYYGRSLPAFAKANPGATRAEGLAKLRSYGRHRDLLARDPRHAAGMVLMRTVEAGAYAYGAWQGRRDQGTHDQDRHELGRPGQGPHNPDTQP